MFDFDLATAEDPVVIKEYNSLLFRQSIFGHNPLRAQKLEALTPELKRRNIAFTPGHAIKRQSVVRCHVSLTNQAGEKIEYEGIYRSSVAAVKAAAKDYGARTISVTAVTEKKHKTVGGV